MDECTVCHKKNTSKGKQHETHHINYQSNCDENDFVKDKQHIKKNDIFNLTVLCSECHDRLHNGEFKIKQKVLTTNGEKLLY
jgi:DNA mismatch repair protein MutS